MTFGVAIAVAEPLLSIFALPVPASIAGTWAGNQRRVNDDGCVNAEQALVRIDAVGVGSQDDSNCPYVHRTSNAWITLFSPSA